MFFKKHREEIEEKEKLINFYKDKFNVKVDKTNKQLDRINAKLSNGITLRIYQATGHKK